VGTKAVARPSRAERRGLYESLVGSTLRGAWKLESSIDFCAMGAIFTARGKTDHAIRVLDLSLQDRRNVREAKLLEQFHHPNVLKVCELGEQHADGAVLDLW
jgi:hypothetical protein